MIKGEDFLTEARTLLDAPGSNMAMRGRTIINRAYYAAYHTIMQSQCVQGFEEFRKEAEMSRHQALINFLSESQDRKLQYIGRTLRSLFGRRIRADYKIVEVINQTEVEDSVELSEELIEGTLEEWKASQKDKDKSVS